MSKITKIVPYLVGHADYIPTALRTLRELKKDRAARSYYQSLPEREKPFDNPSEKEDLTQRADWLIENVLVSPQGLIDSMPSVIGRQYQGQWAIYACSMTAVALCNLVRIYPDLKLKYAPHIPGFIELLMTDELKYYDTNQWREDALKTLDGDKSHMTYLSLLAWVISYYELVYGDMRYNNLLSHICRTLVRRMLNSRDLNLPSFPNNIIFLPDMMVTLIALQNYGKIHNGEYDDIIRRWVENAKQLWIDPKTGLVVSQYYPNGRRGTLQGSFSALNCTYLAMIDEEFAKQQYELLKKQFIIGNKYVAVKEYLHRSPALGFHIDAGPIIEGRSPTGTAFAMGAATYFEDWGLRKALLKTAELAGKTIHKKGKRHYKLAEMMLTGEAITLAMRTMTTHHTA